MKKVLYLLITAICLTINSSATVYTVNSLANTNTGTGTSGTLFYCISQANMAVGPHTINFSVAGTISVNSSLPTLVQAISIDATTAPGYTGSPVVMLDGTGMTNGNGLTITSANCSIYGLDINNFPYRGIHINGDAADNFQIGATGKGNVVRNNDYYGIQITGADNGKIIANKIGTDPTGMTCAANLYDGIDLIGGANNDSILGNQISCNGYNGIQIGASNNNVVQGNLIGPLLNSCAGNEYRGIDIEGASTGNIIGGANSSQYNKISGNLYWGIEVKESGTINNLISRNSYSCNSYDAIDINTGGNNNMVVPIISSANATTISGTAGANAIIEVFKAQNTNLTLCPSTPSTQGTDYLGTVTANGTGNWTISGSFNGYVTATQRDVSGNTSAFSASVYTGTQGALTNDCSGNGPVGITSIEYENLVSVFPNPTNGVFTLIIVSESILSQLEIYNSLGKKIYATYLKQQTSNEIDLSKFPKGIYFVKIYDDEKIYTNKIVVQ